MNDIHDADRGIRLRDAPAVGLSYGRLRGPGWVRESYGLYAERTATTGHRQRFNRIRAVLPGDAAAAHLTAAQIYGFGSPSYPSGCQYWLLCRPTATDRSGKASTSSEAEPVYRRVGT